MNLRRREPVAVLFILHHLFWKPIVATVPLSFTVQPAAMVNEANRPTAFNNAKSFAASTFNFKCVNAGLGSMNAHILKAALLQCLFYIILIK